MSPVTPSDYLIESQPSNVDCEDFLTEPKLRASHRRRWAQ